jgi:putative MATE family efflux protein
MKRSDELGKKPIGKLLIEQALPAGAGILVMSIYGVVDTIFVGQYVGGLGIAAITVVMPIILLISSVGMAIGVGGASIISRALGANDDRKACHTFSNMVVMTLISALVMILTAVFFEEELLSLFGGKGDILDPAREYLSTLLVSIPFLAFGMMANNVIRAEGEPRMAMMIMVVPALLNFVLDPLFIAYFGWGIQGAALATTIGYIGSGLFGIWFFFSDRSELSLRTTSLTPEWPLVKEIFSIGSVTLARQGAISLLAVVLNNALFNQGGESAVTVYGMITRVLMVANVPVMGLIQGFVPIAGYNYGAGYATRVREVIKRSIVSGTVIALGLFVVVMLIPDWLLRSFTPEDDLIRAAVPALRIVFLATPLLTLQLIGSAYFQAVGKAMPALLLALTKQGFCLIPLLLILPIWFDLEGVWWSFPIADCLAAILSAVFLGREMRRDLRISEPPLATEPPS